MPQVPKPLKTLFNVASLFTGSLLTCIGSGWAWTTFITKTEADGMLIDGHVLSLVMLAAGVALFYGGYRGAKNSGRQSPTGPT